MPKVSGTRKQMAEELFRRLSDGPAYSSFPGSKFGPEEARSGYHSWSETWIITEVCKLVPELREKLGTLGYVPHETIVEARKARERRRL